MGGRGDLAPAVGKERARGGSKEVPTRLGLALSLRPARKPPLRRQAANSPCRRTSEPERFMFNIRRQGLRMNAWEGQKAPALSRAGRYSLS